MCSNSPIEPWNMLLIDDLPSSDIEHLDEVVKLSERAREYLGSMSWCRKIVNGWLDYACGYILAIFYFEIVPAGPGIPRFVWIITGDLPPAYMDGEFHPTGRDALNAYVDEMQGWIDRVLDGRPLDDDIIAVNVPPDRVWAERLQKRLDLIRTYVLDDGGSVGAG